MNTNLDRDEVAALGLAAVGDGVRIDRRAAFFNPHQISIGPGARIDAFSVLAGGSQRLTIGGWVHIGAHAYLSAGDGGIEVGDFCTIGPRVSVHGHSDDYREGWLTGGAVPAEFTGGTGAPIVIEPHVIVGPGSVVLPGVTIGYGAAAGALTVIRRSVASGEVVSGNPQKSMGSRATDRFEALAAEVDRRSR